MNLLKTLLKNKLVIIAVLVGCVFSLIFILYFNYKNGTRDELVALIANASTIEDLKKANVPLPVRLKIPKININATIEYVGIMADGSVGVPKGPSSAAWFDLGPRPGEPGSSVIDGHSGWKNGIPAVFDNLYRLQKGDKIYVEDEKGVTATFIVRELRTYKPTENVPDVFYSSDDKAHLNLITCTGFWNKILKSHSDRLVVFTDKEI